MKSSVISAVTETHGGRDVGLYARRAELQITTIVATVHVTDRCLLATYRRQMLLYPATSQHRESIVTARRLSVCLGRSVARCSCCYTCAE